ncbi:MAG TPA: S-adenosylmethionine decarboxylase [Methanoregulaceae archaeon]|jgi:S-adenosylmethionine/arginine decarboxylase-like enzyme|nr:S-adenosylmethionine decarboxylase [Methanolinea sp.]MDD3090848.1 S-adenosylmethionine decarboxylase [Methanoregulaceae archaeon]MDD5685827.1 S-adenosylmethionine decarboxylase [Methanoregulaceae archaeon]HPJ73669.1 S-adenosylmethionine decarboxylase [Methanoregulaceae archaeon]HPQ75409.1 S-adenosylmethionine decarboxylase [Methanoregulaceae archaeon]
MMLEMKHKKIVRPGKDEDVVQKFRKENAWGLCTSVDLKDCNPETIRNPEKIREFIIELCDLIEMKRFGEPTIVHFGPNERVAGYSMTQLIETSLISGHFANETDSAYLDIFSCKEYHPEQAAEFCRKFFEAGSEKHTVLFRY